VVKPAINPSTCQNGRATKGQAMGVMCMFFKIFTHKILKMRTNIELDDALVEQALKLSAIKTKKDVIHEALKNYVAWMKKKQLLNLKGNVKWEGSLKDMRSL
jgi:Arc/MetJ family transcription regulator